MFFSSTNFAAHLCSWSVFHNERWWHKASPYFKKGGRGFPCKNLGHAFPGYIVGNRIVDCSFCIPSALTRQQLQIILFGSFLPWPCDKDGTGVSQPPLPSSTLGTRDSIVREASSSMQVSPCKPRRRLSIDQFLCLVFQDRCQSLGSGGWHWDREWCPWYRGFHNKLERIQPSRVAKSFLWRSLAHSNFRWQCKIYGTEALRFCVNHGLYRISHLRLHPIMDLLTPPSIAYRTNPNHWR